MFFGIFGLVFSFGCGDILAKDEYPIREVEGIVKNVTIDTANRYTTIEFEGKIIVFDGVYPGVIFQKDKWCIFQYRYAEAPFDQGTHIENQSCQK